MAAVWDLLVTIVAVALACIPLALSVWALLDAARRPGWAWALCNRNQAMWIAIVLFGMLTVIGGIIASTYYLLKVRPVIAAAEDGDLTR